MSDTPEQWEPRIAEAEARAEKFQRLHAEGMIEHELRKAAEEAGAFNASQIVMLLKGSSRLVEADGKHAVRVVTTDENGKEVFHTVAEAIGHAKQKRDNENLFVKPAPVQPARPNTPPKINWKTLSQEEYRKIRAEHPEWIGLDPLPKRRR
jgi:hypothetical protein